ncbi:MAG TPA: hypothetical protein VGZ22_06265 [Isosphaeraceae bacterium]|jgi:hypothetical protein|nr:hypothetical protein [Isosphaeraceae bacterium]
MKTIRSTRWTAPFTLRRLMILVALFALFFCFAMMREPASFPGDSLHFAIFKLIAMSNVVAMIFHCIGGGPRESSSEGS